MPQDPDSDKNTSQNSGAGNNPPVDNQGNAASQPAAPKVLSLSIKDLTVLYTAYMPFVAHGGLFIPTKKAFSMGDILPLVISIMDDTTKYSVEGKVVWITPNTNNSRTPGIGVQFMGANADELSKKIQNVLVGNTKNTERTNTM